MGAPGSETLYDVHSDHLDTPRMLVERRGAPGSEAPVVVWRSVYEAYGAAHIDADPDGDATAVTFNVRFPGQYCYAETGLHYNRFRYYDPSIGRYISVDPIGQEGGVNVYLYAFADPVNMTDAAGLQARRGGRVPPMAPNEFSSNSPGSGPIPNISAPLAIAGAFLQSLGLVPGPSFVPAKPGLVVPPDNLPDGDPFAPAGFLDGLPNPSCDPSIECCT